MIRGKLVNLIYFLLFFFVLHIKHIFFICYFFFLSFFFLLFFFTAEIVNLPQWQRGKLKDIEGYETLEIKYKLKSHAPTGVRLWSLELVVVPWQYFTYQRLPLSASLNLSPAAEIAFTSPSLRFRCVNQILCGESEWEMGFEKIKVANPIVEMDGEFGSDCFTLHSLDSLMRLVLHLSCSNWILYLCSLFLSLFLHYRRYLCEVKWFSCFFLVHKWPRLAILLLSSFYLKFFHSLLLSVYFLFLDIFCKGNAA